MVYDVIYLMRVYGFYLFNITEIKIIIDRSYVFLRFIIENLFYFLVYCMCIVINFNYFE